MVFLFHVPGFTPLGSPKAWYKADALVLNNNDPVDNFTDSSGNSNHMIGSGITRPLYKTNIQNSLPALRFGDSALTYLIQPAMWGGATAITYQWVLKIDADPSSNPALGLLGDIGSSGTYSYYPYLDSSVYDDTGSTVRKACGNPAQDLTVWHIYTVTSVAGAWTSWHGKTQFYTTGTNTVGVKANGQPQIMGSTITGRYSIGYLAELIVYSSALSQADRETNIDGLTTKWGI